MGLLPCLGSADSRTFGTAEKSHRVSRGPAIVAGGPENAGLIRPITIVAPKGCLANPTFPAPTIARFCPGNQLADTVMKALSAAMPGNVSAGIGNLKVIAFLEAERGSFIERGERKRMQHRRAPAKERPDPRPQRVLTRLVGDGHGVLNVGLRHVAERHRKGAGSPRDTNARQALRAGSVSMWRADGSSRRTISG
jgi:hypothetical protein